MTDGHKTRDPKTRVAIVGTSNIGAVKYALPEIARQWPEFEITTYGLPGARFAAAGVNDQGRFRPDPDDPGAARLARRVNGAADLDMTRFDAVLVIGDTMGMPATLFAALNYDVVDWPTRRGRPLLSGAAFQSAMAEATQARVDHLCRQFAGIRTLYAALAPYPTTAVVAPGPHHQQPYAGMADHPEATRIQKIYLSHLKATLAAAGITFVHQPGDTVAQPFLTRPEFGQGAMDFRTEGQVLDDHRHMNAAFGLCLFGAFAKLMPPPGSEQENG